MKRRRMTKKTKMLAIDECPTCKVKVRLSNAKIKNIENEFVACPNQEK
jgi:hypothetical protein